jgi:hypothetical protein
VEAPQAAGAASAAVAADRHGLLTCPAAIRAHIAAYDEAYREDAWLKEQQRGEVFCAKEAEEIASGKASVADFAEACRELSNNQIDKILAVVKSPGFSPPMLPQSGDKLRKLMRTAPPPFTPRLRPALVQAVPAVLTKMGLDAVDSFAPLDIIDCVVNLLHTHSQCVGDLTLIPRPVATKPTAYPSVDVVGGLVVDPTAKPCAYCQGEHVLAEGDLLSPVPSMVCPFLKLGQQILARDVRSVTDCEGQQPVPAVRLVVMFSFKLLMPLLCGR